VLRGAGQASDHHLRAGVGHAACAVVFGTPVAVKAQGVCRLGEINSGGYGVCYALAGDNRGLIKDGEF